MNMHAHDDTIAAIATPPGSGGRAIVRLSGPQAWTIARTRLTPTPASGFSARMPVSGDWVADDALAGLVRIPVTVYPLRAPKTYTREDVAEIHLPGNDALAALVLQACIADGARLARAGEFTLRAFLNGRIDLTQAEAVEQLIGARSEAERRAAVRHLDGDVSRRIRSWRGRLVQLAAMIEGALDFEPDEFEPLPADRIAQTLLDIRGELAGVRAEAALAAPARGAIPVFFAGLTNAGKSALVNALLGREAAVVSSERSTTRDVLEFAFDLTPFHFILQDAPGHDSTPGETARLASGLAARAGRVAGIMILAIDGSIPPTDELSLLRDRLPAVPVLPVLTKSDLPHDEDATAFAAGIGNAVRCSAADGTGLDHLRTTLASLAAGDVHGADAQGALSQRIADELARADEALERAALLAGEGFPEILAEELRAALLALGLCIGEGYAEEVLESIFSRFCIGK